MLKGRLEDERMLTGRGRYVSDWNLPGQAHACFVRSDRAPSQSRTGGVVACVTPP